VCQPGFGGAGCAPCAVGSYKEATSHAACQACPAGSTTVWDRSVALADCVAAPGFSGDYAQGFQPCAAGAYKPTTGYASCTPCPPGSTSPAGATNIFQCVCSLTGWRSDPEHPMGCTCQPGFARAGGSTSLRCSSGFFVGKNIWRIAKLGEIRLHCTLKLKFCICRASCKCQCCIQEIHLRIFDLLALFWQSQAWRDRGQESRHPSFALSHLSLRKLHT
jgi:hypothetical protein